MNSEIFLNGKIANFAKIFNLLTKASREVDL